MPKKMSCDDCFFQICCHYDRAIRCLTDNYSLRKEKDDEETNSGETPIRKMEGENPG